MLGPTVAASPATMELDLVPFPEGWVIEGSPQARAKEIARSDDGAMIVIVWSCTKGRFCWRYDLDEMLTILSGEVIIIDHCNIERRLGPGDTAFFPAGSSGVWRVTQEVRKLAVCRLPMPRLIARALRLWYRVCRPPRTGPF